MDIDISDILASVSRPVQHDTRTNASIQQPALVDSSTSLSDHKLLTRAWTSERSSPSLLPYPTDLIDRTMTRIRDQIGKIEDMTSGISSIPGTSTTSPGQNTNLILSILQTDLSRTQFILRSYLRQRLSKLDRYALYYLRKHRDRPQGSEGSEGGRGLSWLSPAESLFLENHQVLLSRFYERSFLDSFPVNLRRLDDRAGGVDMVESPDWGLAVVVRCLAREWSNEAEVEGVDGEEQRDVVGGEEVEGDEKASTELRMRRDEVWVVRWRDVRKGVLKGDLEVL